MQEMWKNVLIFLNCKAVAKILPAMSGKAETLTWRGVSNDASRSASEIVTDVENSVVLCYDKSAVKTAGKHFYIIYLISLKESAV